MMIKQLISLFLLLLISTTNASKCNCKKFENNIYQVTATLPNLQPFYGLLTLLSNGVFFETNNIADGNSAAEIGINVAFNVHSGFYDCSANNTVNLIELGYVYPSNATSFLQANGATAVHDYDLQFLNNDNRQCNGTLKFGFYTIGSNPFDSSNKPLALSSVATVTCQYLSGRNFELPATTS